MPFVGLQVFEMKDPDAFGELEIVVVGLKSDSKMTSVTPEQGENVSFV